ncbi:MAG: NUDIX domain-containing protein [Burkholderiaceae bacterium]|nr:NUDIX domain-containing protein [Burkholderiaceae bacterium]
MNFQHDMDLFAPRRLSCGILILNGQQELLLCHVTGQDHWDLPKGGAHEYESPLQAALRETREETGLDLVAEALRELGRFDYRPKKDLHLFAALMPRLDVAQLRCESQFSQYGTGQRLPEMDGYDWVGFERVGERCTPKMAAVLCGRLDLRRVLDELMASSLVALAA